MENRTVYIRAYNKVWKIENRIYAIYNFTLPMPISLRELGYFATIVVAMLVLGSIFPAILIIPSILRNVMIPAFLTKFFLKKKLDGKMPLKYLVDWIQFQLTRKQYIERFQVSTQKDVERMRIEWFCSRGTIKAEGRTGHGRMPN